jgi:hypothetical protein
LLLPQTVGRRSLERQEHELTKKFLQLRGRLCRSFSHHRGPGRRGRRIVDYDLSMNLWFSDTGVTTDTPRAAN